MDNEYLKKMDYAIKHNLPFYKIDIKYPCVMYDDFQDFENSKLITTKEFDFIYDCSEIIKQEKINYNFQMEIDTNRLL